MTAGQQETIRRNLVAQAAAVWGGIENLDEFIHTGNCTARPEYVGRAPEVTPDVARYRRAMEIAGKFIMPEEVDAWLALDEKTDEPVTQAADKAK